MSEPSEHQLHSGEPSDRMSANHVPSWNAFRTDPDRVAFAWYRPRVVDLAAVARENRRPLGRFTDVASIVAIVGVAIACVKLVTPHIDMPQTAPPSQPLQRAHLEPLSTLSKAQIERIARAFDRHRPTVVAAVSPRVVPTALPVTSSSRTLAIASHTIARSVAPNASMPAARRVSLPVLVRAVRADAISYVGRWEAVRGRADGRTDGMSERSHVPGATATFGFAGRGVTIYGVRGLRGGYAEIAIDGIVRSSHVSFRAGLKRTHVPVFVANGLMDAPHRVEITVLAQAPAGYVNLESLEIRR